MRRLPFARLGVIGASMLSSTPCFAQAWEPAPPLILNAAPQNEAVFLSWSVLPGASYSVLWRPKGSLKWRSERETDENFLAVDSLVNGKPYEFQLEANDRTGTYRSEPVQIEPRRRNDCNEGTRRMFCTQESFLHEVSQWTNSGVPLLCGGRVVQVSPLMPNCLYRAGTQTVLLDRYSGELFIPPSRVTERQLVRRVLLRSIWGSEDFDQIRSEVRDRITELPPPSKGRVDSTASVKGFLVRINPQLYSRLRWFTKPNHVEGHFAIVHEGHSSNATLDGQPTVDWLLAKGWQVIAIDMPLDGINEVDRKYPFFTHADFDSYEAGDTNPLQWFFLPVVAAMDLIYDAPSKRAPTVLMIGRSGGGWTTMMYSAMDPRISVAINVAGGSPASTHMSRAASPSGLPDYEQVTPKLYDQVSFTDIMLAAGSKAAFFFYNTSDPCCFRFSRDNAWIRYLARISGNATGKTYRVFLDDAKIHGMNPRTLSALGAFLSEISLETTP